MNTTGITRAPVAFALLAALACAADPGADDADESPAAQDPAALVGSWNVTGIVGVDGEELVPGDGATPVLDFTDEAEPTGSRAFAGTGGCNRLRGTYDAGTTGRISFGPTASTQMACPEPVMRMEQRLLTTLQAATRYAVEGGRLRIDSPAGTIHLERE